MQCNAKISKNEDGCPICYQIGSGVDGGRGLSCEARKGEEGARPSLFELRRALHFAAKQSFDIDKIHAAHGGIELPDAPEGYVCVHDTNQHLWSRAKMGKIRADGQIDVIAISDDLIEPDPFPQGYQ